MITAMLLAHLVGDYVLQWDALAAWKSRALAGVAVHAAIVTAVTWLFALPFAPDWWQGILERRYGGERLGLSKAQKAG